MREFIKILRRFVPPYKKYLFLTILFNILSAILNIFSFATLIPILQILFQTDALSGQGHEPVLMPITLDNLKEALTGDANYYVTMLIDYVGQTTTLLIIGLVLTFLTFLKTGMYFLSSAVVIPMRTGIVRDLKNSMYQKVTSLPMGFFTQERKGDIIARVTGDVSVVENSIMTSLDMLFKNPILIISYFVTLLVISWQLTLFTLVFVPVMGWIMGVVGKKLKAGSLRAQSLWSDSMSMLEETLGGLRIIKAFCAEEKMNRRYDEVNNAHRSQTIRVGVRQSLAHPMSEFLGTLMIVIVLWFGGILVLGGHTLSGPTFIYYLVILYSIINPLKEFSKAGYNIPVGLASVERIDKILDAENNIREIENPKHISSFEHQIEFRDVSFAYDDASLRQAQDKLSSAQAPRWILKHINLTIKKGQTIALVGQSGGGKSTLVDLIPRFYDVQEGEVLIDGINIKELGIKDLRALIGNVNQEAILFNDTFRNNITFGVADATQEEIDQAAKIANAYDFITESEDGYDTCIGDRGSRLSGGQRQRVSIARAILKNPPILILDEATSALDTESEHLVQEALDRLMKTRTTVAVAHRLSTIKNADEICVIHEGEIVERGTHDELIQKDGYYKKLWCMQKL